MKEVIPDLHKVKSYAFQNRLVEWEDRGMYILVPAMDGVLSFYSGTWKRINLLSEVEKYVKDFGHHPHMRIRYLYEEMLEVLE